MLLLRYIVKKVKSFKKAYRHDLGEANGPNNINFNNTYNILIFRYKVFLNKFNSTYNNKRNNANIINSIY